MSLVACAITFGAVYAIHRLTKMPGYTKVDRQAMAREACESRSWERREAELQALRDYWRSHDVYECDPMVNAIRMYEAWDAVMMERQLRDFCRGEAA